MVQFASLCLLGVILSVTAEASLRAFFLKVGPTESEA
jgi:hypothetical protein